MAGANVDFPTEVIASAWNKYRKKWIPQFIRKNLFLWWVKQYGMYQTESGSPAVIQPIILDQANGFGSFNKYDHLPAPTSQTMDAARFPWRYFAQPIMADRTSLFESGGDTQAVNLWKGKQFQAEKTMDIQMGVQATGDGTANDGKDLVGLKLAVEYSGSFSTYGGINSNTYTNWRANVSTSAGSFASNGEDLWLSMFNTCSQGMSDEPSMILTTKIVHQAYEKIARGRLEVRLTDLNGVDSGFRALLYKGKPVMYHDAVPAGVAWFLNFNYIGFTVGDDVDFIMITKESDTQWAKKAYIIAACNFWCVNRSAQGAIAGFTA